MTGSNRVLVCPRCETHARIILGKKGFVSRLLFSKADARILVGRAVLKGIVSQEDDTDLFNQIEESSLPENNPITSSPGGLLVFAEKTLCNMSIPTASFFAP